MIKMLFISRIQALAFILLTVNCFAVEHRFSLRDSQTGALIEADVMVHLLDKQQISTKVWQNIKLGKAISKQSIKSSNSLIKTDDDYLLETNEWLQYLVVKAKGYQILRTYIEPDTKIKTTSILLDRINKEPICEKTMICGYIYDQTNLEPLDGAKINLTSLKKNKQTSSNDSGYFEFQSIQHENAELLITHKGYKAYNLRNIPDGSSFILIIDLEAGYGIIEKSMKHPINTATNQTTEKAWLNAKLSHIPTIEPAYLKERSTAAVYIEPPETIRVGFNPSGGSCCGASCATSQVFSLETYVQKGLDNEWIASWQDDSLKAGSIPYRSYGAWHVLNQVYSGYDICAGPCCQAFDIAEHPATVAAAIATNSIMLDINGEVARSEYSAQNNSWDDPNDGLNCSNIDLSCGNGSVGSPDTGWACLLDTVSTGKGCFGHGRGMSQWGTQYHAQAGEKFSDILDHYYNASNQPSGLRSQYASTPIRLDSIKASSSNLSANEVLNIDYEIFNSSNVSIPFGPILLGASLVNQDNSYSDVSNEFSINLTLSETNVISRNFQVPANIEPGTYELRTSVYLDVDADETISVIDWKLVTINATSLITILHEDDLIFKDSF